MLVLLVWSLEEQLLQYPCQIILLMLLLLIHLIMIRFHTLIFRISSIFG